MTDVTQSQTPNRFREMILRRAGAIKPSRLQGAGRIIGWLAYQVDVRHRRIIRRNLAFIFPERSRRERDRLALRVFQHFGAVVLESLQALVLTREQFIRRIRIEGQAILTDALAQPRGCILFSGHLGNWELGLLAGAASSPSSQLPR